MTDEDAEVKCAIEQVVLQKIKLAATTSIAEGDGLHDMLANADFRIAEDWIPRMLVGKMSSYVWGMNERRLKSRWPTDWKQAVKLRFAPAWFRRRWPVRYHEIDEPQFEAVYLSLHGDKITTDPGRRYREYSTRLDPVGGETT